MKRPYLRKLYTMGELTIWLVDGRWVREHLFMDFTQGGHDIVYDWIPKNQVWIDDDLSADERPFVIEHELYERDKMKKGMGYERAHGYANVVEKALRLKAGGKKK